MKSIYVKTKWVDNKTPVNASNLNKIEDAIYNLNASSVSYSDIVGGDNIDVSTDNNKNVTISTKNVISSTTCNGIEFISEDIEEYEEGKMYLVLESSTNKLKKIVFNKIVIYEVEQ